MTDGDHDTSPRRQLADGANASVSKNQRRVLRELGYDLSAMRDEVVRALEFMDSAYHQVLTITDVAAAAGISPRRLQELVRAATSESPMNVLRQIRMLYARQMLLDSAERRTVGDIARAAQLLHLGRFSVRYAAEFGESPSKTARRVRQRPSRSASTRKRRTFDVLAMERIEP
ncbi:transcriptional regulator GlxA family with amidase domain [Curtobacterium luteum]|uniref:Transcriptional regulator GlxA family with amidase domain n=1 Tax=Curtobacterium luteum TaxID=33881 RepID=A0A8H9GDY8_9MICO|nr:MULTISPECIES: helix-turn-helix transcriptional regulator [Curtobacterium]MBM7803383.1 transcriptional regulator GlxA family with amidase domain [Curtobacterium luteum]NUU51590.1 helix-turn-helix transcriptional regulator [Curtobacterium luteum]GGL07531.1 hypothetical protein GCM10009769_27260 [Curtobacterium luteum]